MISKFESILDLDEDNLCLFSALHTYFSPLNSPNHICPINKIFKHCPRKRKNKTKNKTHFLTITVTLTNYGHL